MPYTAQDLPFSGSTPMSRHASWTGAEHAATRAGTQLDQLLIAYRTFGPLTDHEASVKTGLVLATICARRGTLVSRGLVEAKDLIQGPHGPKNTRWGIV